MITLCVAMLFLGTPRSSRPCSPPYYGVAPPEVDLGVVVGFSPEPPSITGGVKRNCPDEYDCCVTVLELSFVESDAELFAVDGEFVRPAAPGMLVIPSYPGRPPFEVEVVAWKEIGYRSAPTRFLVTKSVTRPAGESGGCG